MGTMIVTFLALAVVWLALLCITFAGSSGASDSPPLRLMRRLNLAMLLLGIATAFAACATPIVPLVRAFEEIALLPPDLKTPALELRIAETKPLMPVALLALPVLVAAPLLFIFNRRALRRLEQETPPR